MPLADRIRPQTLDEVVGQQHLLAPGSVFRNIADSGQIPNMIFYGPSGVGKTTVARIVAKQAGKELHRLNGTTASTADIKQIIAELDTFSGAGGILLYLDEIQYLNKKQQQTLLEFLEDGSITRMGHKTTSLPLKKGDVIRVVTPGAGGYGDPKNRPAEKVLKDVIEGKVSVEAAKSQYGVVVEPEEAGYRVNEEATKACRAE